MKTFPTSAAWCLGILFISVSLITTGSSEVQVVGPADPVVALAGDDIILPCSLKPSVSAEDMVVKWTRVNLTTGNNVHRCRQGRVSNEDQSTSYKGRTSMFNEDLKNGNVSLKLTRVTLSDAGSYRCFIPTLTSQVKETTVQLFPLQHTSHTSKPPTLSHCLCPNIPTTCCSVLIFLLPTVDS
uniref:Ig-like domain-containing protein n=1 Tax=Salmo trutta TaxID=8032 RepID=A0A673W024_SALTR